MSNHGINSQNTQSTKQSSLKTKVLTIILAIAMLSSLFQLNIFALANNNSTELTQTDETTSTSQSPTDDSGAREPEEGTTSTPPTDDTDKSEAGTFSLISPAQAAEEFTITYYSNYPADSGLEDKEYEDPTKYESGMTGIAATLVEAGFRTPENYYILGWNPSPNAGTAQYPESGALSKIAVDWHLYAVWMPYKTMDFTISDSTYTSTYNAKSHTDLITWPTAYSTAWAGEVISGLTYEYSVNGGEFSATKPTLVDAGNYTITVKASAPKYTTVTTTVNAVIQKAPLSISPDVAGSYAYGGLLEIAYVLPAVGEANGPKSQADETALSNVFTNTNPLFDAFDSSNIWVSDLATALPDSYTVKINSSALTALQNNSALSNYNLSATGGSFSITALSGLTVWADPLDTIYDAQNHDAVSGVNSSLTSATIEYSIDGGPFNTVIPQVKDAGSYKIEIRATANGYSSATITLTAVVEKRDATLDIAQHNKTAGASDPVFSATISGLQGSDTIDYTLTREPGESVGTYAITADVVDNSNYNLTVNDGLLTITSASVSPSNPGTTPTYPDPTPSQPEPVVTPTVPQTDITPDLDVEPAPENADTIPPETEADPAIPQLPEVDADQGPQVNIDDANVPLARNSGAWSLLNLILTISNIVISFALVIGYFTSKRKDDEQDDNATLKRKGLARLGSVIVALVSTLLFILTQDLRLDMVFIDRWTFTMIITTIIQIIAGVLSKKSWEYENSEIYETA